MSAGADRPRSLAALHPRRLDVPCLLAGASVALGLGLCLPLIQVEKSVIVYTAVNEYSVWTGVTGLWEDGDYVLSAVVFFFSFVFPIAKLALLAWIWFARAEAAFRARTLRWLEALGRWSMLDVFAVAILIVAAKLEPLASVKPERGVYFFGAAILASMAATILVRRISAGPCSGSTNRALGPR